MAVRVVAEDYSRAWLAVVALRSCLLFPRSIRVSLFRFLVYGAGVGSQGYQDDGIGYTRLASLPWSQNRTSLSLRTAAESSLPQVARQPANDEGVGGPGTILSWESS